MTNWLLFSCSKILAAVPVTAGCTRGSDGSENERKRTATFKCPVTTKAQGRWKSPIQLGRIVGDEGAGAVRRNRPALDRPNVQPFVTPVTKDCMGHLGQFPKRPGAPSARWRTWKT